MPVFCNFSNETIIPSGWIYGSPIRLWFIMAPYPNRRQWQLQALPMGFAVKSGLTGSQLREDKWLARLPFVNSCWDPVCFTMASRVGNQPQVCKNAAKRWCNRIFSDPCIQVRKALKGKWSSCLEKQFSWEISCIQSGGDKTNSSNQLITNHGIIDKKNIFQCARRQHNLAVVNLFQ